MPTKATAQKVSAKGSANKASESKTDNVTLKIGGRVSVAQIEKACSALSAHRKRTRTLSGGKNESNDLPLDGEEDEEGDGARSNASDVVWMQITIKSLNVNAPAKPIRVPTPHPIYAPSSSVCLLTADPQRTYKDLMVEQKVTQVKRVVGATKLKGKFAPYEARRQLMNDHDLFLADDRIIPMLPKLLGKKWMSERKTPIPVMLTKTKDGRVRKEVESALASTFYHRNKGTCASVRLGTLQHLTPEQLAENAAAALPLIVTKHVKNGWSNVQSIDIKTGTSAALPVWNCNVSDRWEGLPEMKKVSEDSKSDKNNKAKGNKAAVKPRKRRSVGSEKDEAPKKVTKTKSS